MVFNCKVKNLTELQAALDAFTDYLTAWRVSAETVFDSRLVACELLANELKHAREETGMRSRMENGFIELKVFSKRGFEFPENVVCSDVYSESGRGLFLVKELCGERIYSEENGIRVLLRIKE